MTVDEPPLSSAEITAIAARIDRPIVLVGLMGVGKSSVGRRLASILHLPFTDADDAIEEAAQMTINEIFAKHGEQEFRDGERRVISRLMEDQQGIIATGGGAFVNEETRALILDKGLAIWLDADLDTLVERVGRKDNRPLLRNGNPREILAKLKAEREPAYAQAPIHIFSMPGPHQRTVNAILKAINAWL
ncbi:shikimate kinase [Croceicoccus estronivorus]|uniref:shikimate kinase n=1 Tax=Croceicoccus estronivorus TaxID=1172626 RepID=UPI00082C11AA|nr:shikimate kinase [Croceicoccus estronivorus]OCC25080.1 shikimate kinase [Croceicoccus estronivorus]